MSLKEVWQQARETRQAEWVELRQAVALQRSQNQTDLAQMAIELRESLAPIRVELQAQNQMRQLEAQCYQAGLAIEAQDRRESIQHLLQDLNLQRQQSAQELRSNLAAFRADLTDQTQTLRQQRQADVQAIRDYVWGNEVWGNEAVTVIGLDDLGIDAVSLDSSALNTPIPATLDTIEALLEKEPLQSASSKAISGAMSAETSAAIDQQLQRLDDRILSALSLEAGVRLNALQSTLKVSRNDLVRGLQQLIQTRQVVARDRMYFRSTL